MPPHNDSWNPSRGFRNVVWTLLKIVLDVRQEDELVWLKLKLFLVVDQVNGAEPVALDTTGTTEGEESPKKKKKKKKEQAAMDTTETTEGEESPKKKKKEQAAMDTTGEESPKKKKKKKKVKEETADSDWYRLFWWVVMA